MSTVEQRRFPRVKVNAALAEAIGALSAQVTWPNAETSPLADLSYKGFAAQRPGLLPIAAHQRVKLAMKLGGFPLFVVEARIGLAGAFTNRQRHAAHGRVSHASGSAWRPRS